MDTDRKNLKLSAYMAVLTMIAILITLTSATYAWFTFSASTNVEPLSSTISKGDSELLISNKQTGPFNVATEMVLSQEISTMKPLSTVNLEHFYTASAQNTDGITVLYKEETDSSSYLMHGFLYLESIYGDNDVYFYRQALKIGGSDQLNASLRLALKVTTKEEESTYIFNLDSLVAGDVTSKQTTTKAGTVVASVNEAGQAELLADPSLSIGDFFVNDTEDGYSAGKNKLCYLEEDEIGTVEYWLYLEGCDENCLNSVQAADVELALAFAGVTVNKQK